MFHLKGDGQASAVDANSALLLCSASVFGVSPESMQCCYDSKGNSVPTILLLMQERLYAQGGLKVLFNLTVLAHC